MLPRSKEELPTTHTKRYIEIKTRALAVWGCGWEGCVVPICPPLTSINRGSAICKWIGVLNDLCNRKNKAFALYSVLVNKAKRQKEVQVEEEPVSGLFYSHPILQYFVIDEDQIVCQGFPSSVPLLHFL